MSGCSKLQGIAAYQAAEAGTKSVNSANRGINHHRLGIVMVDSSCEFNRLMKGASDLISRDDILFIMGPNHPYFINRLANLALSGEIPLFLTTGSRSLIRQRGVKYADWVFGTTIPITATFRALLSHFESRGIKKAGILIDNTNRGKQDMLFLKGYAPEYGISITKIEQYNRNDKEMMLQMRELKKSGAEIIMVSGEKRAMPALAESAVFAAMPIAVPVQMLDASFMVNVPSALELWTALPPVAADNPLPLSHPCAFAVHRFYLNMPERFNSKSIEEKLAAGAVWDALHIVSKAANHINGRLSRQSLKTALEKMDEEYRGVSGLFMPDKRDHSGLIPASLIIKKFKRGG